MTREKEKVIMKNERGGPYDYYYGQDRTKEKVAFTIFPKTGIKVIKQSQGIKIYYNGVEIVGLWDYELVEPKNEVVITAKCGQNFYSMLDSIDKSQEIDSVVIRGIKYKRSN